MYITKCTFQAGDKTIESGSEVALKDLGLKAGEEKRYIELGLLVEKPKAAKSKPQSDD